MKKLISLAAMLLTCLAVFATEPGLYLKEGDTLTRIESTKVSNSSTSTSIGGFGLSKQKHEMKNPTSEIKTTANPTFLFVFSGPKEEKSILFDFFGENVRVENYNLYKLSVNKKNKRIVDTNMAYCGFKAPDDIGESLSYTKIDELTYEVTLNDLEAGEYAFFYSKLVDEDSKKAASVLSIPPVRWEKCFCFTVQ